MKKRRESDGVRERNGHKRALDALTHPPYRHDPYATPSVLGTRVVKIYDLNVFDEAGRENVYKILRQISQIPLNSKVALDFSRLDDFKISALLILYAHLEIMLIGRNKKQITWQKPRDEKVEKNLSKLGLWALLGEDYKPVPGSIRISSVSHEQNQNEEKQPLRDAVTYAKEAIAQHCQTGEEEDDHAFSAISESFTNVWQHAYEDGLIKRHETLKGPRLMKKWWIAIEKFNTQLFMAVYDVGVGIPYSTQSKKWYENLRLDLMGFLTGLNSDCQDIKTALEYGVSRYKEQGRGNGLPAIKRFVEINPDGHLHIMSGRGIYEFRSQNKKEVWTSTRTAYPGTLIQWNLALGEGGIKSNERI